MYTDLIFDFDGTLADTEKLFLDSINNLSSEFGYPYTKEEMLTELKNSALVDLIKLYKIPLYKLPFLAKAVLGEMSKKIVETKLYPGIKDVLNEAVSKGKRVYILSSNSKDNINAFLKKNELNMFTDVYTSFNIFGKPAKLRSLIKKYKLDIGTCIYFGDEVRDIEACKKVGMDIISVSWGYNSFELLSKYKPTYLIKDPSEIIEIVNK